MPSTAHPTGGPGVTAMVNSVCVRTDARRKERGWVILFDSTDAPRPHDPFLRFPPHPPTLDQRLGTDGGVQREGHLVLAGLPVGRLLRRQVGEPVGGTIVVVA